MKDYYIAATVRLSGATPGVQFTLWMQRIQAPDLAAARNEAVRLIDALGMEYGRLDALWDASYAHVVRETSEEVVR